MNNILNYCTLFCSITGNLCPFFKGRKSSFGALTAGEHNRRSVLCLVLCAQSQSIQDTHQFRSSFSFKIFHICCSSLQAAKSPILPLPGVPSKDWGIMETSKKNVFRGLKPLKKYNSHARSRAV